MRYRVSDLLKSSLGRSRDVELESWLEGEESQIELTAPLTAQLQLVRDPAGILVMGRVSTRIRMACARCLEPVELEIEFDLSEHFRPTVTIPDGPPIEPDPEEEQEDITDLDKQHVLDLGGVLWQNLELAVPALPLCRPDCLGLCPSCGANRNVELCACEPEPDPRWADLAEIRARMEQEPKED